MSPSSKSPTPSELSAALLHRQFGYPPKPSAKWVVFRRAPQAAGIKFVKVTKLLEDKLLPAEVSINEQPSVASTSNECMKGTLLPRKGDDVSEAVGPMKYVPKEQLLSGTEQVTIELDTGLSDLVSKGLSRASWCWSANRISSRLHQSSYVRRIHVKQR